MLGLRPHGRSGLKLLYKNPLTAGVRSPPTRAEWIEIIHTSQTSALAKSPPTRAEWIEID